MHWIGLTGKEDFIQDYCNRAEIEFTETEGGVFKHLNELVEKYWRICSLGECGQCSLGSLCLLISNY